MSDLRDKLAEAIGKTSVANDGPDWGWLSGAELLPPLEQLIQRRPRRSETERAREETAPTSGPKET